MYLTKANTKLIKELTKKIADVLESFTYDEIICEPEKDIQETLFPYRYYTNSRTMIEAVMMGERGILAVSEMAAVAINAMLGAEVQDTELFLGCSKLNEKYTIKGDPSLLDKIDAQEEDLDDLRAVCDMLDGYGLKDFVKVDLTGQTQAEGICFYCASGDQRLLSGGVRQNSVYMQMDLLKLAHFKCGGITLKDPVPVVLVASDLPETAYKIAFGLRRQGLKAEGYILGGSMYAAEEYCALKGIPSLIWADDRKVFMKNIQSGEIAETTLEKLLGNTQK